MTRRFLMLVWLAALPAMGAWQMGDDLSNPTNWASSYRLMRGRSVMNMHGDTNAQWFGANWYLSSGSSNHVLPNIDPVWWNYTNETRGGWVHSTAFNESNNAVTYLRDHTFAASNARNPYADFYVHEMQESLQDWFLADRFRWSGESLTNWTETAPPEMGYGGVRQTLTGILTNQYAESTTWKTYDGEMFSYSSGVRRCWEMTNMAVYKVSGTLDPDLTGFYEPATASLWKRYSPIASAYYIYWDAFDPPAILINGNPTYTAIWTNSALDGIAGSYAPVYGATGSATVVARNVDRAYIFTNGWSRHGDFIGFWQRDDANIILTNLVAGWYVPDKAGADYEAEDANQYFQGSPNEIHESIPLYMRSGSYEKMASWNYTNMIGLSTQRVDLIVSNTASPECDGWYFDGYRDVDYGRFVPPDPAAYVENVNATYTWAIYGTNGMVWVSATTVTNEDIVGVYDAVASPTNDQLSRIWTRGLWTIGLSVGTTYILYKEGEGGKYFYRAGDMWGTYDGLGLYTGQTAVVNAEFYYRQSGVVTGVYATYGTAYGDGIPQAYWPDGDGWVNFSGLPNDPASGLIYINQNYTNLLAANSNAMADFSGPTWNTYSASKGGHERRLDWSVFAVSNNPPDPSAVSNIVYLTINEYDDQYSPGCIVAHQFGNGATLVASNNLPEITAIHLFTDAGYLCSTSKPEWEGLNFLPDEKFPFTPFNLIDFRSNDVSYTYFEWLFMDITNAPVPELYGPYSDEVTETNFVGWTMQFEFTE